MRHTNLLSLMASISFTTLAACSSGGGAGGEPAIEEQGLCGAIAAHGESCSGEGGECDQALVRDCGKLTTVLNPTALTAAAACTREASCDSSVVSCLATGARAATPTDAQRSIATAFCERCAKSKSDTCASAFYGADGESSALGALLLPFGDAILSDVVAKCIDGVPFGCPATFSACAQGVIVARAGESIPADTARCLVTAALSKPLPTVDAGPDAVVERDSSVRDTAVPATDTAVGDTAIVDTRKEDTASETSPCASEKGTNDAPERAKVVENVGECDVSSKKLSTTAIDPADDDWFVFTGSPSFGCQPDPYAHANAPTKLCVYAQCNSGTTVVDGGCSKGTTATKTIGGAVANGCCDESAAPAPHFKLKCEGGKDSTSKIFIESTRAVRACLAYDIDYHF
jgi:hypothetical protein